MKMKAEISSARESTNDQVAGRHTTEDSDSYIHIHIFLLLVTSDSLHNRPSSTDLFKNL